MNTVTAAILAGGRSRRMGTDKGFVTLHGRPLIDHVIERVAALSLPTMIVANDVPRYKSLGLDTYPDLIPGKGSLGGLFTALYHSQTEATLCVAYDMPLLNPTLLLYLITLREDFDAVVPVVDNRPQGMHAIYRQECLPVLAEAVRQDQLRITDFHADIRVRYVDECDLRRFDPQLQSFVNVNTPQDLQALDHVPT